MKKKQQLPFMIELPDMPGYFAGEDGEIYSNHWPSGGRNKKASGPIHKLKTGTHLHGYRLAYLWVAGKSTTAMVRRLICTAFHGPQPSRKHYIRNLDGDVRNDLPTNLAWTEKTLPTQKRCPECNTVKGAEEFYVSKDRLVPYCVPCYSKRMKMHRQRCELDMEEKTPSFKVCRSCNTRKASEEFYPNPSNRDRLQSDCVDCVSTAAGTRRKKVKKKDPIGVWLRRAFSAAKCRAKKKGLPFEITKLQVQEMLSISPHCSLCDVSYSFENSLEHKETSPSIDRILPEYGYVQSNVQLLCHKCNSDKGDLVLWQAEAFLKIMERASRRMRGRK